MAYLQSVFRCFDATKPWWVYGQSAKQQSCVQSKLKCSSCFTDSIGWWAGWWFQLWCLPDGWSDGWRRSCLWWGRHLAGSILKRTFLWELWLHWHLYLLYGRVQMSLCILGEHFWKCSRRNIFLLSIPFNSPRWVLLNGNIKRTIFQILQCEKCSPNVFYTIDVESHYLKLESEVECCSPLKAYYLSSKTGPPYLPPLFTRKQKS